MSTKYNNNWARATLFAFGNKVFLCDAQAIEEEATSL